MQIGSIWNNSMNLINSLEDQKEDTSLQVVQDKNTENHQSNKDSVILSDEAINLSNTFENNRSGSAIINFAEMDGSGNEPP